MPTDQPDLSLPGQPSPGEVRQRAAAILHRVRAISDIFQKSGHTAADPTTACALLVLGTSLLMMSREIAPEYLDLVIEEMKDLGRAHANAVMIRAASLARDAKEN